MNWPFISRIRHLQEVARLRELLAEASAELKARAQRIEATEQDRDRFRGYYERLADDTLMRTGQASAPVHENPERRDSLTNRIARGFALVGNAQGAPITGPSHAATHTTQR